MHSGICAAASAAALSAHAFTVGSHIVLGREAQGRDSAANRRLLAHELAHVVQQSRGGPAPAGSPALESEANAAADAAAGGRAANVDLAGAPGIAALSIFDEFTGGKYSWPMLKLALIHDRPVRTIIDDLNALPSIDRDRAIEDITRERIDQGRQQSELRAKHDAQTDPALKAMILEMARPIRLFLHKADEVLDGVFATIAGAETKESLKATVAPSLPKHELGKALVPDTGAGLAGQVAEFKSELPGDPISFINKLRLITPPMIENYYRTTVVGRGEDENKDPAKIHPLAEFERIGNASRRETLKVFPFATAKPPLKADTRTKRGNIHDRWKDQNTKFKRMTPKEKRAEAGETLRYFFRNDEAIALIRRLHNARPGYTVDGKPVNDEARDLETVVKESTEGEAQIKRLNEIERGWEASAGVGDIKVQIFRQPDQTSGELMGKDVADRDFLWDMFQVLIHEYLHLLAHPEYDKYALSFGSRTDEWTTLIEGVDTLLDEVVWSAVEPRVNDPALRREVEGPVYAKQPAIKVQHPRRRHYDSYKEALKLVNLVGIRNLYAAYFEGDVKKIQGV